MKTKVLKAINELGKYYDDFNELNINDVRNSDKTYYENGVLYYNSLNHALLYLVNYLNSSIIEIDCHFTEFGTMIDLSRNAVFTVDYMKDVIRKQALMGVNKLMLYTEDIYEVKDEPYFGYMRGKYTKEEIKEIVQYANIFDIEIIPCIQTLGHMEQFLRWGYNHKLKDQSMVLMTEIDEVYTFIDKCVKSIRDMYQTNKIHIGMDETFGLGLGKYYKMYGYEDQYTIFINHLKRVNEICLKNGFVNVMIWSDMFFRISSKTETYYDLNIKINDSIKQDIPSNVQLVYWDYYNKNKQIVDGMLKKHIEITNQTIMASGTWIWSKLVYDKQKTDNTALVHIDACKNNNIDKLYFTQWNDDGAPCNYETVYLGLFDMAAHALTIGKNMDKSVYKFIMKSSYQEALIVSKLNESPINPLPLLWDDPLLGIYLNNEMAKNSLILDEGISFFKNYLQNLKGYDSKYFEINHVISIAALLYDKLLVRKTLLDAYHHNQSLTEVIPLCERAIIHTEKLLKSYRQMWLSRYKAFGLDVIQSRLATLIYRYKETIERINDLISNHISQIDELEEKVGPHQNIKINYMNIAHSSIFIQTN